MTSKKLAVDISDETIKQLSELGDFYKKNLNETISIILKIVGNQQSEIISLNRTYEQCMDLEGTLIEMLRDYPGMINVFNDLPRQVGAEGQLSLDPDIEFNWNGDHFRVSFDVKSGNKSSICRVDFIKQDSLYCFSTNTMIDSSETSIKSMEKLESMLAEICDPFDSEEFNIQIDKSPTEPGENLLWTLTIDCWEESPEAWPELKQVDKFVKRILKKASVTLQE